MKESCPTENGVVTTDWAFYKTATILLPVTCSLSSDRINCMALRMTSQKIKQIKISPARMEVIHPTHTAETKATLSSSNLAISVEWDTTANFNPFKLPSWRSTLNWKYWLVIGSLLLVALGVIITVIYRATGGQSAKKSSPIQVSVETTINTQPGPQQPTDNKPWKNIWGSMRRSQRKKEQHPQSLGHVNLPTKKWR